MHVRSHFCLRRRFCAVVLRLQFEWRRYASSRPRQRCSSEGRRLTNDGATSQRRGSCRDDRRAANQASPQSPARRRKTPARSGPPIPRKIQYGADFQLVTDHFLSAETTLQTLIAENQGYVSFADVYSQSGSPRHGTWKARIPIAKFDAFRKEIARVGEVIRTSVQTKDVTADYFDLEEHIKSQKVQEEATRELLKRTTDKIENILAVRRELGNLRDEIERSEGRLRLMANLTDLTTVSIQLQEFAKFDPDRPTPTKEDPTFAERAGKAFREAGAGWSSVPRPWRSRFSS